MLLHRSIALLVSVLATQVAGQAGIPDNDPNAACTVCNDGRAPVTDPTFKFFVNPVDTDCATIIDEVGSSSLVQGDNECKDYQLLAFQIGCCEAPPYEYCDICPDGSEFTRSLEVPIGERVGTNPTCAEIQYRKASLNGIFEAGVCSDTQLVRGAFYCGCPNVEQQCYLCPNEQPPTNPERGDNFIFGSNCEGIEYLFSLFTDDECSGIRNDYGIDYAHFCKCADHNKTSTATCELCSGGIANPDFVYTTESDVFTRTCAQAQIFADSITRENVCLGQMQPVLDAGCQCNSGGVTFTEGDGGGSAAFGFATFFSSLMVGAWLAVQLLI